MKQSERLLLETVTALMQTAMALRDYDKWWYYELEGMLRDTATWALREAVKRELHGDNPPEPRCLPVRESNAAACYGAEEES